VRTLLLTVLALAFTAGCSKTESPLHAPAEVDSPAAPEAGAADERMPAMPSTGVDFHKIPAGNYSLIKSEVFSRSKWGTEDDYSAVVSHDVTKGELKASHFEFAHPRVDGFPISLSLPLSIEADGTKTIITEEKSATYLVSRGNRAELKIEDESWLDTLFDHIILSGVLNENGVYEKEYSIGDTTHTFRLTATVTESSVVVHWYNRNLPVGKEGSESLYRFSFQKHAVEKFPALPTKGLKIENLPHGKYNLERIRTYLKESSESPRSLVADYFPSGELNVLHLDTQEETTELLVEYPETMDGHFGTPVYGDAKGKIFTINKDKEWTKRMRVEFPRSPFEWATSHITPDESNIYRQGEGDGKIITTSEFVVTRIGNTFVFYRLLRSTSPDGEKLLSEQLTEWVYEQ